MKHTPWKTTDILEKIVLLLPLLIVLGFAVHGLLAQPVLANQTGAFITAPDGDQAESKTQSIVPALLPAGRRLFQSPIATPTFTPTPEVPTPTNTPEPPTPTNTPEPPTPTNTPEPPTPTNTPEPPTPTNTPSGFVSGGGWIDSGAGAYKHDPTLSGKANFAFYSKYKRGATVPTGNTEFNFQAGDLNFHSDSYQWLVINQNGSNAQFKGVGTINGASSPTNEPYSFMVRALDDDPDAFRLVIWYETPAGDAIVYDNGFSQPIGGGSIVVYQGK